MKSHYPWEAVSSGRMKEIAPAGVVQWFRVLLWWGTAVARQILPVRKPKPAVVRLSPVEQAWPLSSWVFTREKVYGIFFQKYEQGVRIYEFPQLEEN